jgi:hypothetical protein
LINIYGYSMDNIISGGDGRDIFVIKPDYYYNDIGLGNNTITDFALNEKIDLQLISEISDLSNLTITQVDANTFISFGLNNERSITLKDFLATNLTASNFVFRKTGGDQNDEINLDNSYLNVADAKAGNDIIKISSGVENYVSGGVGDDIFVVTKNHNSTITINDFEVTNSAEKIQIKAFDEVKSFADLLITYVETWVYDDNLGNYVQKYDANIKLGDNQNLIVKNVERNSLTESNFEFKQNQAPIVSNTISTF